MRQRDFESYCDEVHFELGTLGDCFKVKELLDNDKYVADLLEMIEYGWGDGLDPFDVASDFYDAYIEAPKIRQKRQRSMNSIEFDDYCQDICGHLRNLGGKDNATEFLNTSPAAASALFYMAKEAYEKYTPAAQVARDFYDEYMDNKRKGKRRRHSKLTAKPRAIVPREPDIPVKIQADRIARAHAWKLARVA